MAKEVSKKTGVILLLAAVILVVIATFGILNYIQAPKVIEVEGHKESASSGEITLTVEKPPIIEDESTGSLTLEVLPSGGKE